MKKQLIAVLCTAAMIASLAGCSSSAPASTTAAPAATTAAAAAAPAAAPAAEAPAADTPMLYTDPIILRFASSGSGSDYTDIGTIISFLSEDGRLPAGSTLTQETISGGTSSSGYLIEAGQADVTRGQNAFAGTVGFNGRPPYSGVNALFAAGGNSICLQIVSEDFQKKTGFSSIEEVIENKYPAKICSEDVGSSDYVLLNYIFEIMGTSAEEFESWGGTITYTGNDTASEMMQDGSCDLLCMASTLTSSTVTELNMSAKIHIDGFSDKIVDGLMQRGFAERYIPAGTFDQFPEDTRSCYIGTSINVSKDMDERIAYTLTKVLIENIDNLAETCPTFKNMTKESAIDTSVTVVPLHPGAIKYFQEIGLLDESGNPKA